MAMVKTYRRDDDGALHYREVWTERGGATTHEGKVGTKGKSNYHSCRSRRWPNKPTPSEFLRGYVAEAIEAGCAEVPADDHGWAVLQCWTHSADLSHPEDTRLFDGGQEALGAYLGWRGVGHLDGNDFGGSPPAAYDLDGAVLNLFCKVIDTALGVKVVRGFVRDFGVTPYHVIGAREPGEDSPYVLAYSPRKRDKDFSLF